MQRSLNRKGRIYGNSKCSCNSNCVLANFCNSTEYTTKTSVLCCSQIDYMITSFCSIGFRYGERAGLSKVPSSTTMIWGIVVHESNYMHNACPHCKTEVVFEPQCKKSYVQYIIVIEFIFTFELHLQVQGITTPKLYCVAFCDL